MFFISPSSSKYSAPLSALALIFAGVLISPTAIAIESLGYSVIETHGDIEIRRYEPHLLATVEVDGEFEKAGNSAFRDLFNYIDGNNADSEKIAMTAPVIQQPSTPGWKVSFVMPAAFDQSTLPEPLTDRVILSPQPEMRAATITYSGNWSQKRYLKHETQLRAAVAKLDLNACDEPRFARHNPPFWPSFLRKNEILLPLCEP